jgi:glucokinase
MILAGDIGGTKTVLALFEPGPPLCPVRVATFPSASYPSLEAMMEEFRPAAAGPVAAAALGVAGPILGTTAVLPNLPWSVDAMRLATGLRLPVPTLLNDVEASVWALELLRDDEAVSLLPGTPVPTGNQAVISAGTGLGEGMLIRGDARRHAVASEAGHADFAARTDLEIELLRWLRGRLRRVSWERVLSGRGLANLHAFLTATGRGEEPPAVAEAIRAAGDPAAVISAAGLDGTSERCALALDLFTAIYGAEAGNLVLRAVATGGVFLGGGIAPKILPWLRRDPFRQAFLDKGRLSPLVAATPVKVIVNERAPLLGAARRAVESLEP